MSDEIRDVALNLKLVADRGNANVAREIEDQIVGASNRMAEQFKQNGEKLRGAAEKHGKEFGEGLAKGSEQFAQAHERHMLAAEVRQERMAHKFIHGAGEMAGAAAGVAKGVAMIWLGNEEHVEKLAQGFLKIAGSFEAVGEGVKFFMALNDQMLTLKRYTAAAAAEQITLNAAQAGGAATSAAGAGAGVAKGVAGAGAAAGGSGLAGGVAAMMGTMATNVGASAAAAGAAVAPFVAIAATAVALNDILAAITGKGVSISGGLGEILGSIKRSAELEGSMKRQREVHESLMKSVAENDERIGKTAEGAARIETTRRQTREIAAGGAEADELLRGFNHEQLAGAPRTAIEADDRRRMYERESRANRLKALDEKVGEGDTAVASAESRVATARRNVAHHRGLAFPTFGDKETEQPDPSLWGSAWRGITDVFSTDKIAAQNQWGATVGENRKLQEKRGFDVPSTSPISDLGQQVAEEQKLAEASQKRTDAIKERIKFLKEETTAMAAQVQQSNAALAAAKEKAHLAERSADSRLAHFGEMDAGKQNALAGILEKANAGKKLTMQEIQYGKQAGLNEEVFNRQLAGNVTGRLGRALGASGDPALIERKKAQDELQHAQKARDEDLGTGKKLASELQKNIALGRKAGIQVQEATGDVEHTKAQQGGYADPNDQFKKEGKETRTAWQNLSKEITNQFALLRAEISKTATQLKGAHN
jgi:hypothetical protein